MENNGKTSDDLQEYALGTPSMMGIRETRTEKLTMKVRPSEEELYAILAEYKTPGKANISDLLYHICALGIKVWLETREFIDHDDPPTDILERFARWTENDPHALSAKKRLYERAGKKKAKVEEENGDIEVIGP